MLSRTIVPVRNRRVIVAILAGLVVSVGLEFFIGYMNIAVAVEGIIDYRILRTIPRSVSGVTFRIIVDSIVAVIVAFPAVLAAVLIAARQRRDHETRCRKCGYILRGLPEPRCSECGTAI